MTKPNELELIKQHIQRASNMLRHQSADSKEKSADMGSLIYMGNHHDSVPRELVTDAVLDSGEIHTWMLMKIHISNPHLPSSIPSQNDLIDLLKCSRPVVSRHMQVLRAMRWITLCDEVRGDDGRIRGHVYAQHDSPLSIQDTLVLDPGYIEFMEKPCSGDVLKRLRSIKDGVLRQIHQEIRAGADLNQSPTRLTQLSRNLGGINADENHVKNIYMAQKHHVKKIDMDFHHVKNFNMDEKDVSSGSNIYNKNNIYINTTTTSTTKPESLIKNLNYPSFIRDSDHLKTLASELLNRIVPEKQQFALDYLADRVRAGEQGTDKPVGNVIAYLNWITKNLNAGTLPPSAYGVRNNPDSVKTGAASTDNETPEETQRKWIEDMRQRGYEVDPETGALEKIKQG